MIKRFYCGMCREKDRRAMIRQEFRKHLRDEHLIKKDKFNGINNDGKVFRKKYVIEKVGDEE